MDETIPSGGSSPPRFAASPLWRWLGATRPHIISPWAAAVYLLMPSVIYSIVFKQPRIVLDPIILLAAEALIPVWARRILRLAWIIICGCVLLMDWNIYSDSYLFYGSMLSRIVFTPHGLTILAAIAAMAGFVLLPSRVIKGDLRLFGVALAVYMSGVWIEGQPWGGQYFPWFRTPFERAVQAAQFNRDQFFNWSVTGRDSTPYVVTHHLYDTLTAAPVAALPDKIGMFMVESWGERPADLAALRRALIAVPGVKSVETGYDRFHGATLPGEVRELCGAKLDFKHPKTLSTTCLPRLLRGQGYQTSAVHGFDGFFYSRDVVYPALGFQSIRFRKDLRSADTCGGAFPGRCDDDIAAIALTQLARPGRQFSYMMTLSAHAVIDEAILKRPYVAANRLNRPGSTGQVLDRALVLDVVRQATRQTALAGAMLYFNGDHNPPEEAEALGLPAGETPYVLVRLN